MSTFSAVPSHSAMPLEVLVLASLPPFSTSSSQESMVSQLSATEVVQPPLLSYRESRVWSNQQKITQIGLGEIELSII